MAENLIVKAEKRDTRGKNENRRLRATGRVPAIVYGAGFESMAVSADLKDIAAVIRSDSGVHSVFSLDIDGIGGVDVIFQARQIDPVKGRLIHADLRRLVKGEKLELTIPIHLVGDAEGLKADGAVLSQVMREVKVKAEPSKTPDFLELDITNLAAGDSMHVSDLRVGEGIEINEAPETVVCSIVTVSEADLEPQLEPGTAPIVEGEKDAE